MDAKRKQAEADAERGIPPSNTITTEDVPVRVADPAPASAPARPQLASIRQSVSSVPVNDNPLLNSDEFLEKRQQEITSAFLIGAGTVGLLVGGYFAWKWIISKDTTILEKALETQY